MREVNNKPEDRQETVSSMPNKTGYTKRKIVPVPDTCANCPDSSTCPAARDTFYGNKDAEEFDN